jgi:hypothetical protein
MFGRSKADKAVDNWQAERNEYAGLLHTAMTFRGTGANDLMLAPGEVVFYKVTGTSLVEDRRGAGHYQGHSAGFSVPLASIGGHAVRYRVGASKGHYVQGAMKPTAIDTGTVYITNKRVIFQGSRQTRECAFAKLIGFRHDPAQGSTTLSVSNRQKPTTIHYGPKLSGSFDFRLDLALAHFKGTVDQLVRQLQDELARIDGGRPAGAAKAIAEPASPREAFARWAKGPGGQAHDAVNFATQQLATALNAVRANGFSPASREELNGSYRRLADAAANAMTAPPIPDAEAQTAWELALFDSKTGATLALSGMATNDADLLGRSTEHMNLASRHLGEVAGHIRRIGDGSPR